MGQLFFLIVIWLIRSSSANVTAAPEPDSFEWLSNSLEHTNLTSSYSSRLWDELRTKRQYNFMSPDDICLLGIVCVMCHLIRRTKKPDHNVMRGWVSAFCNARISELMKLACSLTLSWWSWADMICCLQIYKYLLQNCKTKSLKGTPMVEFEERVRIV